MCQQYTMQSGAQLPEASTLLSYASTSFGQMGHREEGAAE